MAPDSLTQRRIRIHWPLAALLAVALLRLIYLLDFRAHSLFWQVMLLDSAVYDDWARRIAAGDVAGGRQVYSLPPLYPYLLAALYRVAGAVPARMFMIQAALGVVNVFLLWQLTARVAGRRAAWLSGLLAALYGPLMFLESKLLNGTLTVTLTLLLLILALRAAARPGFTTWMAAGLALGLLALVRPEMLLFAPLLAWWGWRGVGPLLGIAAGVILMVGPVAVRNAVVAGEFSPGLLVSSQGALTLYQSNNPRAAGLYTSLAREGFSGDPAAQAAETLKLARLHTGRNLSRSEANRYWLHRSLSWVYNNPLDYLRLEVQKLLRFFGSTEYSTEYIFAVEREQVRSLWLTPVPFAFLAACGLPGAAVLTRRRRDMNAAALARLPGLRLMALLLVTNLATCLIFYVSSRYRLPAAVALLVLAGAFLNHLIRLWESGRRPAPGASPAAQGRRRAVASVLPWAAAVLTLTLLLHWPIDRRHVAQEANLHASTGTLHYNRGERPQALAAYTRAVQREPTLANGHLGRGVTLEALGRQQEAVAAYSHALRLNQRLDAARDGLLRLQSSSGSSAPTR